MDANIYETSGRRGKTSLSAFTDEIEGELEKHSIFGVHLTRKVVISIVGFVVGVSMVLGFSLSIPKGGVDRSAFTAEHRYWSLGDVIESSVGKDIYDNSTYQHEALMWLANDDPLKLDSSHHLEEILQRWVLTAFFFQTGGATDWENTYKFLSKKSVCNWNDNKHGVFCNDQNQVTSLIFPEIGLQGEIPHDIGLLSNMEVLNLTKNDLKGTIPISIGIMSSLNTVDFSMNALSGKMPTSLGMLMDLVYLDLSYNELTGSDDIPMLKALPLLEELHLNQNFLSGKLGQFGGSHSLRVLDLSFNSFKGEFSTRVPDGKTLEVLRLNNNQIQGTIPGSFGKFIDMKELDVSYNELTGPVPSVFGEMTSLESLKLNANQFQFGLPLEIGNLERLKVLEVGNNGIDTIPTELFNCKSLETLSLTSNSIYGKLPTEIGQTSSLVYIDLSNNHFSDKLPAQLNLLHEVEFLHLNNNLFNGEVPVEINSLYKLRELDLSGNHLSGSMESQFCGSRPKWGNPIETFRADCLVDTLEFPCATECCDGKGSCCPADQLDCMN